MYNERADELKFDRGLNGLWKYQHGIAGDQADNEGMFVPMEAVKTIGIPPWEMARELLTQHE